MLVVCWCLLSVFTITYPVLYSPSTLFSFCSDAEVRHPRLGKRHSSPLYPPLLSLSSFLFLMILQKIYSVKQQKGVPVETSADAEALVDLVQLGGPRNRKDFQLPGLCPIVTGITHLDHLTSGPLSPLPNSRCRSSHIWKTSV